MREKVLKRILSIVAAMLIICSVGTNVSAASRFSDVNSAHPYYKGVMWAANEAKIANGYASKGVFGVDDACTRGHAMMFLWKLAGKPTPDTSGKMPFKDVPKTHTFYKAILWGAQNGITKGYPDGTFGVNKECTRGQIVTFLWRYKGQPATVQGPYPFKDSPTPAYKKAILWAAKNKITKGYSDKMFHDTYTCTRGQIVTFLYRMSTGLTPDMTPKPTHTHNWEAVTKTVHHDAEYKTVHHDAVLIHHDAEYKTVHHDAEIVHHDAVYEEKEVERLICEACGADLSEDVMSAQECRDHTYNHAIHGESTGSYIQYSYETVKVKDAWDEVVKDAWDEQVKVKDAWDEVAQAAWDEQIKVKDAWDETVTVGYRCSTCGATK